jgi:hypothetical protein
MKILIIQENGRHEVSKHLRECNSMQRAIILQGVNCDVWGLGHNGYNTKPDFNSYDVIINLENYDTGWMPDLCDTNKPLKFLWSIDAHVRGYSYYKNIFAKGNYNYILQATRDYCDKDSLWFPNCYDDDYLVPLPITKEYFIGFCGNFVNRKPYFDYISSKMPFKLDIDVRGEHMIKAINSYKIHYNKNISNDINYRNFETMGCKTALLTDYNSQYNDLGFVDKQNVFFYKNIDEAIDILYRLREDEELLTKVAEGGYTLAKNKHTFKKRAGSLLKFINTKI